MSGEAEIRRAIRQWILDHARREQPVGGLDDTTPILETGLLSSIEVAELVLFLEHLRGREIPLEALDADVFHSVDSLWRRLFAPLVEPPPAPPAEARPPFADRARAP